MNPEDATQAAELAEAGPAYRHNLFRDIYQAGRRAGFKAGYRQATADQAARRAEIARSVTPGISDAEFEERRWGPGGRVHFADPRPGDFPGRAAQPQAQEAQEEMEAGA